MFKLRWRQCVAGLGLAIAGLLPAVARAQGVTTGGITGRVIDEGTGAPLENVQVQVANSETGLSRGAITRADGRYAVIGLEPGDRYTVTVRRIGYAPRTREGVRVTLSQTTDVNFTLGTQATALAAVRVVESGEEGQISSSRTGVTTTISDSALRRLPTISRNFTDFAALTPQVATPSTGGLTGAGTNNRFNNIQIDGATEADVFGLGDTGQPGGNARARSISIESVKQYQVSLSPYDVRQGNFSGVLVNAVTKSGTNTLTGSAYGVGRSQSFTRSQPYINDYDLKQYGFTVGGPIVKDRAFFFINPEIQRLREPAAGPSLGSGSLVSPANVTRFTELLSEYGIEAVGSAGAFENSNPLTNVFARLDVNLPYSSQLVLRHNYGSAERDIFSRGTAGSTPNFPLTSNRYTNESVKNATVAQLRTNFASGAYNEVIVGFTRIRDKRVTPVRAPQVSVIVPGATLVAGTDRFSQANELDQDMLEITENFTLPMGSAHRVTIGTQNQLFRVRNLFRQSSLGVWNFGTLDSLELGRPREYIVGVPIVVQDGQTVISGDGAVRFDAGQFGGYLQDQWTVTRNLNVTAGLRVDVPVFFDEPPRNPLVEEQFGRRTDRIPSGNAQYSPRVGINWDVTGDGRNQLRGGIGSFVGRPAYVWLANAFQNSGASGVALLTCRGAAAPAFTAANVATPPTACANGTTASAGSELNLLSEDLKFPQNLRTTFGYDRSLGSNYVATFEALYTQGLNNPFYQNIALAGPLGTDRYGRVVYGDSANAPRLRVAGRTTVLDVTNQSKDYAVNLTAGVSRRFADRYSGSLFYTFTRAREVQGLTSSTAFSQYRFGRATGGNQASLDLTPGRFETPHRIVAQGSYAFPTRTDLSFTYVGQSGANYEYVVNGDANGDGFTLNDPIYVPRNAYDTAQIRFSGSAQAVVEQQAAFERFVQSVPCLRENRGRILGRNSCAAPWSNLVNLSLNQGLQTIGAQNLSLRVDVFNFLNLLNKEWGEQRTTGEIGPVSLLTLRSKTAGTFQGGASQIYEFSRTARRYTSSRLESNYQVQAMVRYSF